MNNPENQKKLKTLRIIDLIVFVISFVWLFIYFNNELFDGEKLTFGSIVAISMVDLLASSIIIFIIHKIGLNIITKK